MANTADRLNQLQQYMNYYRNGGDGSNPFAGSFGRPGGRGGNSWAAAGGVNIDNTNPFESNNASLDWAQKQLLEQEANQRQENENSIFKGMYAGNSQSQFGAPPAYVQPQNQQQQPNPYSARAMQLNGGGNTLADMFRNYNKGG